LSLLKDRFDRRLLGRRLLRVETRADEALLLADVAHED